MMSKKEELLKDTYTKLLEVGFGNGPLEEIPHYMNKDIMGYGTALDEKIMSLKEFQELINDQRKQAVYFDEFSFTSNPVKMKVLNNGKSALVIDEVQVLTKINNETNNLFLRMSTVFEYVEGAWMIVHWHGSKPEHISGGDDPFHVEQWKKKNEELQKAIDEKTADLLQKNRELVIEASLERVRSVAMGMNKSDDLLKICEVSFKELLKLGFKDIRNAIIHIPNDEQHYFMDYDYSEFTGGDIAKIVYGSHPIVDEYMEKIRSAEDAYFEVVINNEQLSDWKEFRINTGQSDDPRLDDAEALYYYLFSIGIGDIGISTFKPIDESQILVLKRFRNVFDLAYKRYDDIRRAEKQAHEAKIEAALERVRSKSMAMRKSEELAELSYELVKQVHELGIDTWFCAFNIYDDDQKGSLEWGSNLQGTYEKYRTPREGIFLKYYEAGQRGDKLLVNEINEEECPAHYEYLCTVPGVGEQLLKMKEAGIPFPTSQIDHVAFFKYGYIIFITFKSLPEAHVIFKRFANVFEQSYTRFLDLQKAEEQAREAEAEAALERIRSLALGMRKSEEVGNVTDQLFKELINLKVNANGGSIVVFDEENDKMEIWRARTNLAVKPLEIASFKEAMNVLKKNMPDWYPIFIRALEKRENYLVHELSDDKRLQFINAIAEQYNYSEEEKINLSDNAPEKITTYYIYFKLGYLALLGAKELSEENLLIARRFVEVFEFSYTRYLDIKKAEEQAREAQIEAALERVRSRSIGMQNSNELSQTASLMFKEIADLGITPWSCGFNIFNHENKSITQWVSSGDGRILPPFETPYTEDVFIRFYEASKSGDLLYTEELGGQELVDHYKYMTSLPAIKAIITELGEAGIELPKYQVMHTAFFKQGYLLFITFEKVPEFLDIFKRFAKVFEQTYTRFLDLQRAEEQAREAQIEAGLERVRAQSMMMQHSEELNKTSQVFHEQLRLLGIDSEFSYLWLPDAVENEHLFWATWQEADEGSVIFKNKKVIYPLDKSEPAIAECYLAWESGIAVHVNSVKAAGVDSYFNSWPELFKDVDKFKPELFPDGLYYVDAYMKYGCFGIMIRKQLSDDEKRVLHRFAREFERAYTRFLDLQRAEIQSRKAQIEMSLEKVRNVALQLKKSDEMLDIAKVLYEQLLELGFKNIRNALIDIKNGDDDTFTDYDYSHEMSGTITQMSYHDDPTLEGQFKKMATTTNDFFELALEGKELEDLKAMRIKNGEEEDPRLQGIEILTYNLFSFGNGAIGISNFGVLTSEEKAILSEFSNVFTFAYKRYTDLVQAEQQAREALIELSLERIRAQVTAMKESIDLLDIVVTMRSEFVNLGHEAHYFWYMRYLPEIYEKAMTSGDGTKIGMVMTLPRHIHGEIKLLADWEKSDEPTVVYAMDKETAVDYVHKMITLGDFSQVDPNAPTLDDIRHIGGLTFIMARTNHGEIGYSLPGVVPNPPQEDLNLLVRFAGIFDLAYKRFEDLKNTELRNREAIIELALERVRARTMAMQKSNELAQTSAHLFDQLNELGIKPYRCNIAIVDSDAVNCQLWSTTNSGNVIPTGSDIPLSEYPVLVEMYEGWKTKRLNHKIKLVGNDRLEWTNYISKYLPFEEYKKENIDEYEIRTNEAYLYNFYFKQGFFTIHSKEELPEDQLKVIKRFAYVFEQTFTRFLDLVNAEKQNKIIQAENKRKTEELEEARQLQLAMLPKDVPKLPRMEIAVYMKTATEVGGDYYDFHIDNNGNLTAVIGDATGHGMKAGTIVTITKSLFNMLASDVNIVKSFHKMSNVIKDMNFRQLSMCLQMIKITDMELTICSAAMPPALVYRKNKNEINEFELRGMPLGSIKKFPYKTVQTKLHPGDTILLMSDGFPELLDDKKHMYGYERTKNEFLNIGEKNPDEIVEYFKKLAKQWQGNNEPDDDITFVVIKIK